jgi:tetratricopeptide (TPR) repeat protein
MSANPSESIPSSPDAEAAQIRTLLEREQFAAALAASEALVARAPEHRDGLYTLAVSQRFCQKIPDALATLERLERAHPGFSRLYQERGHCYVQMRDAPRAVAAFVNAVNRNPALPASWNRLQVLYRMLGQPQDAANAAAHIETLAKLPQEIVTANALFSDGDLAEAEKLIRAYLLRPGNERNVEAMRLLARIALARDVVQDADLLLEAVLELAPDYRAARYDYAQALLRRHKYQKAVEQLDTLLKLEPANRAWRTTYATAQVGLGQHERALALYRELLPNAVRPDELHLSIAHTLKTLGQPAEAIESYRAAAAARPGYGDAYWSLANLKTYRFTDAEIEDMRAHEASGTIAPVDHYHLCFALGKAHEDRADYASAFGYYERGNALRNAESGYRSETTERNVQLQIEVCTREFFAARAGYGCERPDPIFIVGLPRSGSTLVEQILASHSQVEGTMELADIASMAVELEGHNRNADAPRYPAVLAELSAQDCRRLGEKYLRDTRTYRTDKPYFIDKMPNNFRHIGLIHLILPQAKIIDARREAMACCFSNFKQLFASGQEFTYSLTDIARYYRAYVDLMDHWEQVLPGRILRVQHEALVDDLETHVRRLLDFCGLEFEPSCLEFWKTERSVRTASSEQVRRPLNREGVHQWRHFEPWLDPLKRALAELA